MYKDYLPVTADQVIAQSDPIRNKPIDRGFVVHGNFGDDYTIAVLLDMGHGEWGSYHYAVIFSNKVCPKHLPKGELITADQYYEVLGVLPENVLLEVLLWQTMNSLLEKHSYQ